MICILEQSFCLNWELLKGRHNQRFENSAIVKMARPLMVDGSLAHGSSNQAVAYKYLRVMKSVKWIELETEE